MDAELVAFGADTVVVVEGAHMIDSVLEFKLAQIERVAAVFGHIVRYGLFLYLPVAQASSQDEPCHARIAGTVEGLGQVQIDGHVAPQEDVLRVVLARVPPQPP